MIYFVTIILLALAAIGAVAVTGAQFAWTILAIYFVFFSLITCYGVFVSKSSIILKTTYRLKTPKQVCLTFDDGPDEITTPCILDLLKENNIQATFFVIGRKVEAHPEIARRIIQEGHTIGMHSYNHELWYTFYGQKKLQADTERCRAVLKDICGIEPAYYRPPYGFKTPHMYFYFKTTPLQCVTWDVRGYDTVMKNVSRTIQRIMKKIRGGSIILLHDGTYSNRPNDPVKIHAILQALIQQLKDQGYSYTSISSYQHPKVYSAMPAATEAFRELMRPD